MAELNRNSNYIVPGKLLGETLDAIRAKRDTEAPIPLEDMPTEIGLIGGGTGGQDGFDRDVFMLSPRIH